MTSLNTDWEKEVIFGTFKKKVEFVFTYDKNNKVDRRAEVSG